MKQLRWLPVAGLLVLAAAMPAAASASTQWFYERQPIAQGTTVQVPLSSGPNFMLVLKLPGQLGIRLPCTVSGVEAFWNTPEGGHDETRSISFACGEATVTPFLPWSSRLLETAVAPMSDSWEGVALDLSYGGVDYGVFTGDIEAKVGDVDPVGAKVKEGLGDLDNFVNWRGNPENSLLAPNGDQVWLVGGFHLGGKGWGVTDAADDD
jgi:hypothetical protein